QRQKDGTETAAAIGDRSLLEIRLRISERHRDAGERSAGRSRHGSFDDAGGGLRLREHHRRHQEQRNGEEHEERTAHYVSFQVTTGLRTMRGTYPRPRRRVKPCYTSPRKC